MKFARGVWRLLVGIKDGLALLFLLLFFTFLFGALATRPGPDQVQEGALLLDLSGTIVEEPAVIDPLTTLLSASLPARQFAARDLVEAIDAAARDDRIKVIALDLGTFLGGGHVNTREVADALGRFRQSRKPVLAFGIAMSDDALMLASQADEIWLDPMGGAAIRGPGGTMMFYGEALERFNINAHVYQAGTFKGAGEPYMNSEMSPELRRDVEGYLASLWEEYRAHITRARPQADFAAATTGLVPLLEANGGDLGKAALAAGLVDRIGTREQWGERVARVAGPDPWSKLPGNFAHTPVDIYGAQAAQGRSTQGRAIGVIRVAGNISDSDAGPGSAGAARIARLLDEALEADLAALVVRIDSPGGTVSGSETIRRAVLRHKARGRPVVISMGNHAASGGYWIATAGEQIFAEPETITGSIGVVLVVPTFERILRQYGVNPQQIGTTPLSGQPDLIGGLTPATQALLQNETQAIYRRFVGLVAQARGLSAGRADELAQGRIWTGGNARQVGLVDQFGDLDAALAHAAQLAGLEDGGWHVQILIDEPDPFAMMLAGLLGGEAGASPAAVQARGLSGVAGLLVRREQMLAGQIARDLAALVAQPGITARCLACIQEPVAGLDPAPGASWRGHDLLGLAQSLEPGLAGWPGRWLSGP